MSDEPANPQDLRTKIAASIGKAIDEHGEEAVAFTLQTIVEPMIGLIALFQQEQVLLTLAKQYGLTEDQMADGIGLIGILLRGTNEHQAWLAAEIIARTAPKEMIGLIVAALAGVGVDDTIPPTVTN